MLWHRHLTIMEHCVILVTGEHGAVVLSHDARVRLACVHASTAARADVASRSWRVLIALRLPSIRHLLSIVLLVRSGSHVVSGREVLLLLMFVELSTVDCHRLAVSLLLHWHWLRHIDIVNVLLFN